MQQTPAPPMTFEQIIALIDRQLEKQFAKREALIREELRIQMEKQIEEFRIQIQKRDEEMKKSDEEYKTPLRRSSDFRFYKSDEVSGYMIAPDICEKMNELGFSFQHAICRYDISNNHKILFEIDILLDGSDSVMAVAMITEPTTDDVNRHLQHLETMIQYPRRSIRGTKLYGAIACEVIEDEVRELAFKEGLYIISQISDNIKVEQLPEYFVAK